MYSIWQHRADEDNWEMVGTGGGCPEAARACDALAAFDAFGTMYAVTEGCGHPGKGPVLYRAGGPS